MEQSNPRLHRWCRAIRAAVVIALVVTSSCGSGDATNLSTVPTEGSFPDVNVTDSTTTTLPDRSTTDVLAEGVTLAELHEVTVGEAPTQFVLRYGVSESIVITDPNQQTEQSCSVEFLPTLGETFTYMYVDVANISQRRFQLPVVDLGITWEEDGVLYYDSIDRYPGPGGAIDPMLAPPICSPKAFVGFAESAEPGVLFSGNGSPPGKEPYFLGAGERQWAGRIISIKPDYESVTPRLAIYLANDFIKSKPLSQRVDDLLYSGRLVYLDEIYRTLDDVAEPPSSLAIDLCAKFYAEGTTAHSLCSVLVTTEPPRTVAELIERCENAVKPADVGRCTEEFLLGT